MARQYISSDGGVINENLSVQYISSDGGVINETSGSSSLSLSLSWVEDNDVMSITSTISTPLNLSISWTEDDDVNSLTVNIDVPVLTGTLNWTEENDAMTIALNIILPAGTLITGQFKNNTGQVLSSLTGLTVAVLDGTTLASIRTFTNQTTDDSGIMTLNDALFETDTTYAIITTNSSGTLGAEMAVAT